MEALRELFPVFPRCFLTPISPSPPVRSICRGKRVWLVASLTGWTVDWWTGTDKQTEWLNNQLTNPILNLIIPSIPLFKPFSILLLKKKKKKRSSWQVTIIIDWQSNWLTRSSWWMNISVLLIILQELTRKLVSSHWNGRFLTIPKESTQFAIVNTPRIHHSVMQLMSTFQLW